MNVLVLGGYGNFGRRICESLLQLDGVELIIAGRNLTKANELVEHFKVNVQRSISALRVDITQHDLAQVLKSSAANLLINTVGPFQTQDYTVAKACINARINYFDLADSTEFVSHFHTLDFDAKAAGVFLVTGVSTLPGLSSAVVKAYAPKFKKLESFYAGITPGYQAERGYATTAGILSYLGQPINILREGRLHSVAAMQGLHQYDYHNRLGKRLLGFLDVPDLTLLPEYFPELKSVTFYSGLELNFLHGLLWCMSWLSRWKLVKNWGAYAALIIKLSHLFDAFGTDAGGMFIELGGSNKQGRQDKLVWHLLADGGDGPYVPTIPVIVLIKKLLSGHNLVHGAYPCMGLFTLAEFDSLASQRQIEMGLAKK